MSLEKINELSMSDLLFTEEFSNIIISELLFSGQYPCILHLIILLFSKLHIASLLSFSIVKFKLNEMLTVSL